MATSRKSKPSLIEPETLALVRAWIDEQPQQVTIQVAIRILIRRGLMARAERAAPPAPATKRHPVGVRASFAE